MATVEKAVAEIERLRAALQRFVDDETIDGYLDAVLHAEAALRGEKPT